MAKAENNSGDGGRAKTQEIFKIQYHRHKNEESIIDKIVGSFSIIF